MGFQKDVQNIVLGKEVLKACKVPEKNENNNLGVSQGTLSHDVSILENKGTYSQIDHFTATLSLDNFKPEDRKVLDYWKIEDFSSGYIDWSSGQIILEYKTKHCVDPDYALEKLEEPGVIDLTSQPKGLFPLIGRGGYLNKKTFEKDED